MFKLDHPVFDGGIQWCMFPYCFYQNGVNFLRRLALQEKRYLMTARVSMLLKSRASPDILPFSLCNKKRHAIRHMNRPLFPTTLSIPSCDIGKQVGLRTYQHPLVGVFTLVISSHGQQLRAPYSYSVATLRISVFQRYGFFFGSFQILAAMFLWITSFQKNVTLIRIWCTTLSSHL